MAYKIFISHSARDQGLVINLANILRRFGIKVFVAEWYLAPGERIDKKVFQQIDKSDSIIVLLTRDGLRSKWVHQEIGYALKAGKPIIPLVEKGTDAKDLASLKGREYIEYDPHRPDQSMVRVSNYVKSMKLRKEEQGKKLLVAGGILAFLLLLFGGEE